MDIAKYIGLFLLKNKFCYIHGLGNLELKKRPASHDGQALQGPAYEVTITPLGSIDDNLANFIATNEQISISKAANALREFSTKAKADLHEGKDVVIPSLGKFIEQNGKVQFITDPHLQFTPPSIPTVKTATRTEEKKAEEIKKPVYSSPSQPKTSTVNWTKVIIATAIVVAIIVAVGFGVNYLRNQQKDLEAPAEAPAIDTPVTQAPAPVVADTTKVVDSAAINNNIQAVNGMLSFKVILKTYKDSLSAAKSTKKLMGFGNKVEFAAQDSAYYVVMPVTVSPADSAHLLDSLRAMFNPKGVSILK